MSTATVGPAALPGVPVSLPPGLSIHELIGAITVSTWSSIFAFAVVCSLTYMYFMRFPKDSWAMKSLVIFGWSLTCLDTIANTWWVYDWTVTLWGSIPGAGRVPVGFSINIICCIFAGALVQTFYAYRLLFMSRERSRWIIPALIMAATITQFVTGIFAVSRWAVKKSLMSQLGDAQPYAFGWLVGSAAADVMICAALIYYLWAGTRNTPDHIALTKLSLRGIISRSVQANMFSCISQILTFVIFRLDVGFWFFWTDVMLTKVYIFSLLITLNARNSSTAVLNMLPQRIAPAVVPVTVTDAAGVQHLRHTLATQTTETDFSSVHAQKATTFHDGHVASAADLDIDLEKQQRQLQFESAQVPSTLPKRLSTPTPPEIDVVDAAARHPTHPLQSV